MNPTSSLKKKCLFLPLAILLALGVTTAIPLCAQTNPMPVLQIKADQVTAKVNPLFYGLMTEEINFSYEGGIYGELIRNRAFKADAINIGINPTNYEAGKYYPAQIPETATPKYWSAVGGAVLALDTNTPLNEALNVSLKLDASSASKAAPAGIANGGYWGIPVKPKTAYKVSFYAKAANGFTGPLTVSLESADGKTVFASATIKTPRVSNWVKYETTLTTKNVKPSKENIFKLTTTAPGTIWLQQVSLFPPTYNNRANGNRADIMQLLADMNPKFLRLPGGNYVEGDYFNQRFNWKETIGPVDQRPGHRSCWNYWSTDGLGLLEYLNWCEDLKMEPVLAVFAGYALKHDYIPAGPGLDPYVQEALEEIEYVTGDATTTKWGAQRAKDGHPKPFPLHYVEIGNEDWFERNNSYDERFAQFYDAIRAKYPQLQIISTVGYEHSESQRVHSRTPDLVDEHYYPTREDQMESMWNMYDRRSRTNKVKIFAGEWATRIGSPTPNMAGALGDAAWLCGMERSSDLVVLESYAPLFVNVSDVTNSNRAARSMQWPSDLIGYDALTSYGSPSYWVQQMFSTHHGDDVLATDSQNVPTYTWQPPTRTRNGVPQGEPPPPQQLPQIFFAATRDSQSGTIFLKLVNRTGSEQSVQVQISGVKSIDSNGLTVVLSAAKPEDTNSITEPTKIAPVTTKVNGLSTNFAYTCAPYSITIVKMNGK